MRFWAPAASRAEGETRTNTYIPEQDLSAMMFLAWILPGWGGGLVAEVTLFRVEIHLPQSSLIRISLARTVLALAMCLGVKPCNVKIDSTVLTLKNGC